MINRFLFKLIAVTVFSGIALSPFHAAADVGCLSSNTTYTYINEESNNTRNNHRNNNNYDDATQDAHINRTFYHRRESDRRLTASNFCASPVTPTVACYIHSTRDGFYSSPGTLVNYSAYNNCDLDDYLPFLLISIAGVSMYFLRGRFLIA